MSLPVVCLGAVDHGKSTLIGRLLYDAEQLSVERIEEVAELGRHFARRFEFAYFLDAFEEELREERTMDAVRVPFRSARDYTITDVPGHRGLVRPMLTGSADAAIGVLVVSASEGLVEQSRRHLSLARLLGVRQLLVAVNKMDAVGFAEQPFRQVQVEVGRLAVALGWTWTGRCAEAGVVPLCALGGDNVLRRSSAMPWYQGSTLVEALDHVELREPERPLRFVVQCELERGAERLVLGRVQTGVLRAGQLLRWQPSGVLATVEAIRTFERELERAGRRSPGRAARGLHPRSCRRGGARRGAHGRPDARARLRHGARVRRARSARAVDRSW
jgi:sulfate adenylyltransferase subunit 1 (EFTu-like GTPase family)